jgi:hypothetical protein
MVMAMARAMEDPRFYGASRYMVTRYLRELQGKVGESVPRQTQPQAGKKRGSVDARSPSTKRSAGEAFGSEVDIDGAILPAEIVVQGTDIFQRERRVAA